MSTEVLSQAEVESLLSAMSGGPDPAQVVAAAGGAARAPVVSKEKVAPYDFKRPERVGKEQMRSLQTLHEGFGRNFGAALSALLRSIVEVKLTSVDQLKQMIAGAGNSIALLIQRDNAQIFVPVDLG